MNVLGIDISYHSIGLVVLDIETLEIVAKMKIQNPLEQLNGEYYSRIRKTVQYYCEKYGVKAGVIEDLNIRFLKVGKVIFPIHGIVKEAIFESIKVEPTAYNVSTWRFTILGLKRYSKVEKEHVNAMEITKAQKKIKLDVKNRVIEYVNRELKTEFKYEDNDITDALGLCLAYKKHKYAKATGAEK